jgi:ketosteroid isomerase-like protein
MGAAMKREEVEAFATHWAEAWNRRDVEAVLICKAEFDGTARRVPERLRFDASGQVVTAEVFHGVADRG